MKQGHKTKLAILTIANELFYHKGYNSSSIGDIMKQSGLSKGNITYHFKSKQDILSGIVGLRLERIDVLLEKWDQETPSPLKRLVLFCDMLMQEEANLIRYGCPMGTLTGELSKQQPDLYAITLPMFERFSDWLTQQFLSLDYPPEQAKQQAMSLLSRAQGIAVITHVFKDQSFLATEITHLKASLQSYDPTRDDR